VITNAGLFALELGDFAHAEELAEQGFAAAERLDKPSNAAFARFIQGSAASSRVTWERGEALLHDALTRFETLGSQWSIAGCVDGLGICALNHGDAAAALEWFERSLAIAEDCDDQRMVALDRVNLGWCHYYLGHHQQAYDLGTTVVEQVEQFGSTKMEAGARQLLGLLALEDRDYRHAAHLVAESLQLRWEFGDKWNIAYVLEAIAAIMVATNRPEAAARVYGTIEALREAIDSPVLVLDKADYERNRAAAQAALGESSFTRAWTEGRRLALGSAVSEALETLRTISTNVVSGAA